MCARVCQFAVVQYTVWAYFLQFLQFRPLFISSCVNLVISSSVHIAHLWGADEAPAAPATPATPAVAAPATLRLPLAPLALPAALALVLLPRRLLAPGPIR